MQRTVKEISIRGNLPPTTRPASVEKAQILEEPWDEVFSGPARETLTKAIEQSLPSRRWFRGKARSVLSVEINEQILVPMGKQKAYLLFLQVNYADGGNELYVLPLACAVGKNAGMVRRLWPQFVLSEVLLNRGKTGVFYDAIVNKDFCRALLALTAEQHTVKGKIGELEAEPTGVLDRVREEQGLDIEPSVSKAEQSNSSVIYDGSIILKFFRRLDAGINPELEIERFLSARQFLYSPALAGALEYHGSQGPSSTVAVLTSFIPGCHDAWEDTLSGLKEFYTRVQKLPANLRASPPTSEAAAAMFGRADVPRTPTDLVGSYFQDAITLGKRTASLHLTLASDRNDPAFCPEPWTSESQKLLSDSLRNLTQQNFQILRDHLAKLPKDSQVLAQKVMPHESTILQRFGRIGERPIQTERIRTHGDYHLGQVLHHGSDFLIIDFEGEPAISLDERREKQSALRDVAGMIYSFFYAANAGLREMPKGLFSRADPETKAAWARYWAVWVGTTFLRAYLEMTRTSSFVPQDDTALKALLDMELLRKAIYELGYELNNRPDWVNIAFQVLLDLLSPENPI